MVGSEFSEIFSVATDTSLAESGGGHNTKGIEFQKHWAVLRLFELEEAGVKDFLILFEAIQDVAILDSSITPTEIHIYQVKKKDRAEWTWGSLTSLSQPEDPLALKKKPSNPKKVKSVAKPVSDIKVSPLGKLYATVHSFKLLKSQGSFISNMGCDLKLASGGNVATSLPSNLSELAPYFTDVLVKGFTTLHINGEPLPDLTRLKLERVDLSVHDPGRHLIGPVHAFLTKRSPRHAAQAKALIDALIAKVSPLGGKTDTCKTFDEIRRQHGYTKQEFIEALATLEEVPDVISELATWLPMLASEGMSMLEITGIRVAATGIYRRQVMSGTSTAEKSAAQYCDDWLSNWFLNNTFPEKLLPFFEEAYSDLKSEIFLRRTEVLAHFAIRAIVACMDKI